MQHSHPIRPSINVVLCGSTSVASVFLTSLASPDTCIDVSGYWDPDYSKGSRVVIDGMKKLSGSFEHILKEGRYDALFMCFSPQIQSKVLLNYLRKAKGFSPDVDSRFKFPIVILVPPVSPTYNASLLSDARNYVAFAMPLRKLVPVNVLVHHLKSSSESGPLKIVRTSCLPLHWCLGIVRSFHVRLSVVNPVKPEQYSWLCESSTIGGGVLNMYGAGLIDLMFILTGGLRIVSVSCVTRTFDTRVCSNPDSIRRVHAEDYVLVSAELESKSSEARGPVAMLCLSSDLPCDKESDCENQEVTAEQGRFDLNIELTGSSGRFMIPATGDCIRWNPIQPIISKFKTTNKPTGCPPNNGLANSFTTEVKRDVISNGSVSNYNTSMEPLHANTISEQLMFDGGSVVNVTVQKLEHATEAAYFSSGPSAPDVPHQSSQWSSSLMRQAWIHWLSQFSSSLRSASPKQDLDSLVASPGHWGYIQRVLKAIEKAARMRCWVDIATGEQL